MNFFSRSSRATGPKIEVYKRQAVDGDKSTRWCADGGKSGEKITVDMGRPGDVKTVNILWEKQNNHLFKLEAVSYTHLHAHGSSSFHSMDMVPLRGSRDGTQRRERDVYKRQGNPSGDKKTYHPPNRTC